MPLEFLCKRASVNLRHEPEQARPITAFIAASSTSTAPSERRAVGRRRPVQMPLQLDPAVQKGRRRGVAAR